MFSIISIFEDDYYLRYKIKILQYCYAAFQEKTEPSHVNMWSDDWENANNTLPYLIYKSNRFRNNNGDMFLLLTEAGGIIGNSGVNVSEFDQYVALGGVRTWLKKEYRGNVIIGRYVLPHQLSWCELRGLKTIALTFNEYNKRLLPYFRRSGAGIKKNRKPGSLFYNGQFVVDYPVIINYTTQWVIYHKINEEYEPNWCSIRDDKYLHETNHV